MGRKSTSNHGKVCICVAVVVVLGVIAVVAAFVAIYLTRSDDPESESQGSQDEVSYNLHINPSDPVIVTAQTPEGDVISAIGNKSESGLPRTIDEFLVESANQSDDDVGPTFVFMSDNGTVESAQANNGLRIDFNWDDNETIVYTSIVFNNGSEQLSIRINLSEPVDENFTSFITEIDSAIPSKRSVNPTSDSASKQKTQPRPLSVRDSKTGSKVPTKRQSDSQTSSHADVFVTVQTCNEPETNARVFADVLLDYDEGTRAYEREVRYWGTKSGNPGEYTVRIPTSKASMIVEDICDGVNMILGTMCATYSNINRWTKTFSGHEADSVLCFFIGKGLRLVFPALRVIPVHRFCKNIFKPFKAYCKYADSDIPGTEVSPIDLVCDALSVVDNGIDLLREQNILFTPTAIFQQGNQVQGTGQVLTIPPGTSIVPQRFTISDDGLLRITAFSVVPFDPIPHQDYVVTVSYSCYSTPSFSARMTIVGTDTYTDVNTCLTGPTCVLFVPGAEALVRDDVNIFIQNGQSSASRMVVIIF